MQNTIMVGGYGRWGKNGVKVLKIASFWFYKLVKFRNSYFIDY